MKDYQYIYTQGQDITRQVYSQDNSYVDVNSAIQRTLFHLGGKCAVIETMLNEILQILQSTERK